MLAFVNATAILVIAAGIFAIIAIDALNDAAVRLAGTVSGAVLAEVGVEPEQLLSRIEDLNGEMRSLQVALSEGRSQSTEQLQQDIADLTQRIARIDDTMRRTSVRLTDESIRGAAESITDGLLRLRNCQSAAS